MCSGKGHLTGIYMGLWYLAVVFMGYRQLTNVHCVHWPGRRLAEKHLN